MKTKAFALLSLVGCAFLFGTYTSSPVHAQHAPLLWSKLEKILHYMTFEELDDGTGTLVPTIRITGANLQVVNGLDATNGYPLDPNTLDPLLTTTNSAGNLIVGYNEMGNVFGDDRTGSHNIVLGHRNNLSSFGGIVGARNNSISGAFASVSAGKYNTASGVCSMVSGGRQNTASASYSSVSGGYYNTASGLYSSVSGGDYNTASGYYSSVSGGFANTASGGGSSVSGGNGNVASGSISWIGGGGINTANDGLSSVSGGFRNVASGVFSSVSGGYSNTADGYISSVSGGYNRSVYGTHDWAAGSLFEDD